MAKLPLCPSSWLKKKHPYDLMAIRMLQYISIVLTEALAGRIALLK